MRWNSSDPFAWQNCAIVGNQWIGAVSGAPGNGTLEVRDSLGGVTVVPNVKIGRNIAGFGQSNMFGSTDLFYDQSANTNLCIYDPRPSPQTPMIGRTAGQKWGPAHDKGYIPDYLAARYATLGVPLGFVRFAVGSTRLAWWEPDASVDAGGLGYSVQYLGQFVRAVIESQGFDYLTYNPDTDPACIEAIHIQIGETDARSGTSKASFKASLIEIAAYLKSALGADVQIYVSVLQDLFTTGYVAIESQLTAIQDAVYEAATEDANINLGPDYSDYVLTKVPPETNGNVHFFNTPDQAVHVARWVPFPENGQPLVDGNGDYLVDSNGDYIFASWS